MHKHFHLVLITFPLFFFSACNFGKKKENASAEKYKLALMQADESFAALSAEKGLKDAYLEFIDSNGVLLRPNVVPIAGADAVDYIIALNDTGYTVTWKPTNAIVANSGELGYTYGVYKINPSLADTALYGTYVSIWKKQGDGKWKFILQSNNEGIGEEE